MKKIIFLLLFAAAFNICTAANHSVISHITSQPKNDPDEGTKLKLIINGKTYDIQMYTLNYRPKTEKSKNNENELSLYSSSVITITIRASKLDQEFIDWIFTENPLPRDGQIILYDTDSGKNLREITFTGATIATYSENNNAFNFNINNNQTVSFSLKYKAVSVKATDAKK